MSRLLIMFALLAPAPARADVTIGVPLPLTGPAAGIGQPKGKRWAMR